LAKSSKIKVMISSRCDDTFPLSSKSGVKLSAIRVMLKQQVEASTVLGERPYEIWIHEKATEDAELDSWDECLRQARECDIFVVLYNGNAGWAGTGPSGTVGICQAEFNAAYSQAPGKVFIVNIFEPTSAKVPSRAADKEFQKLIERGNRFGRLLTDPRTLEDEIRRTIVEATVKLVQRGVREANRGKGYLGPALEWNRQSYSERQTSMIAAIRSALTPGVSDKHVDTCTAKVGGAQIVFRLGAVPDSISIATAREMVGQPHLADHASSRLLARVDGGPVHIIACRKGVTEAQAQRMLGFPNATVVNAPFGVYVLDPIQAIQLVLISNCVDEMETRHGVQRFLAWLPQAEQSQAFVRFAKKRKEVISVLAQSA
jgi:hypothetical protein